MERNASLSVLSASCTGRNASLSVLFASLIGHNAGLSVLSASCSVHNASMFCPPAVWGPMSVSLLSASYTGAMPVGPVR